MNYRDINAVNFSSLKHMAESPASYKWHLENPTTETPAMRFGTAFHCAVLEPDRFLLDYVVQPEGVDLRTKDGKTWKQENADRVILSRSDSAQIAEMAANFRAHPLIEPFLSAPGSSEIALTWTDEETGLACKGRLDRLLDDGSVFDVKTTSKFSVRQFQSHAWDMHYHAQLAFYADGARANGFDPRVIAEGVVSTNGPFDCALYTFDKDIIGRGRQAYRGWLRELAERLDSDEWPGQYPEAIPFKAPAWAGSGEYDLEHSIGAFVDALKKEVQ